MAGDDQDTPPLVVAAGVLLNAFVYAPLGAAIKLLDDGPSTVKKARQDVRNARFLGEMAVRRGSSELKERLNDARASADDAASEIVDEVADPDVDEMADPDVELADLEPADEIGTDEVEIVETDADEIETDEIEDDAAVEDADDLAIPDYDHLPAIDIVDQLETLSADELAEIEAYERENRRRRTVLGKIAKLTGAE